MKYQKLLQFQELEKISKRLYKKYREKIVDIFLFGSCVKGKLRPNDLDLAVLFKNSDSQFSQKIYSEFKKETDKEIHYNGYNIEEIFSLSIFSTLLEEGYSLIHNRYLSELMGYEASMIFNFNLKNLTKSKKVLFSYALHGHNSNEVMLKKLGGKIFGKAVVIIPESKVEEFREFFELWDIDFEAKKVLIK